SLPALRLAPRARSAALERQPQRLGGDALARCRGHLQPSRYLLRRPLPQGRRALREPALDGARRRRRAGTLARVPGSPRPRPIARPPAELVHTEAAPPPPGPRAGHRRR